MLQNLGAIFPAANQVLKNPFFISTTNLILPIGISFYCFESMSFVIDVYCKKITAPKKLIELISFIVMFPRFIAGPIIRFKDMHTQINHYRKPYLEKGIFIFIIGLFLKICFADSCAIFVKYAFDRGQKIEFLSSWLGAFSYTMQIYFDFHGYSLMAIGLGHCLGFQFPSNFNKPYLANSLSEFWKRWHMTLSSWLRDYLYFPLGGNRLGKIRTALNILITLVFGGLWHGASWTFILWGLWHAFFLIMERIYPPLFKYIKPFWVVMLGQIIFRSSNLFEAQQIFGSLFNLSKESVVFNPQLLLTRPLSFCLFILSVYYCFILEKKIDLKKLESASPISNLQRVLALFLLTVSLLLRFSNTTIPFLYYQF